MTVLDPPRATAPLHNTPRRGGRRWICRLIVGVTIFLVPVVVLTGRSGGGDEHRRSARS